MLQIAAVLLGLAALGGAGLAFMHLTNRHVPFWAGIAHGLPAAAGVGLLMWWTIVQPGIGGMAGIAFFTFLLAAAGGVYMFWLHGKRHPLPPAMILTHGLVAVIGYTLLLYHLFG